MVIGEQLEKVKRIQKNSLWRLDEDEEWESFLPYVNSVVYSIKDTGKDELLYIGSTHRFDERCEEHKKEIENINSKNRLYEYIRSHKINWKIDIVEEYPCSFKGELLFREYELINTLEPKYNTKKLSFTKCNCQRIVLNADKCNVCKIQELQKSSHQFSFLEYGKANQETCGICGSYGMFDKRTLFWDKHNKTNDLDSHKLRKCIFCKNNCIKTYAYETFDAQNHCNRSDSKLCTCEIVKFHYKGSLYVVETCEWSRDEHFCPNFKM